MWLFMIYRWPLYVLSLPSDVFRKWIALWHTRYKMLSTCFISNQSFNPVVHYKACTVFLYYIKKRYVLPSIHIYNQLFNRKSQSFISINLRWSNKTSRNILWSQEMLSYVWILLLQASELLRQILYCILLGFV